MEKNASNGKNENKFDLKKSMELLLEKKPVACPACGGKLFYTGAGIYECGDCKAEVLDDYGKVRKFIEDNGPSPAVLISEGTGVALDIIELFLSKGKLEIPEGSNYYIKCGRCGCSIRYGRFCPECTRKLAGEIKAVLIEDMGEKPKREGKGQGGKMHFLNKELKK